MLTYSLHVLIKGQDVVPTAHLLRMVCQWIVYILFFLNTIHAQEGMIVGFTPQSQRAVQRGLQFLASQQDKEGGFWRANVGFKLMTDYYVEDENKPHVGITAMACMAFMANGNIPGQGPYGSQIRKAIRFIMSCQEQNRSTASYGLITKHGTRMYSHAFATLCLAEAYGMTHDLDIRPVLKNAVQLIITSQNEQGAWRYVPGAKDADMSIAVCQVQALRAARNVGIHVPKQTIDRAVDYVRRSAVPRGGFHYQVLEDTRTSFALTAAGLTAMYSAGEYDNEPLRPHLNYLKNRYDYPSNDHYFYYYGHYYAIQAMYMAGGEYWNNWYPRIREELLDCQQSDGSWQDNVGKIYSTAVALVILQMPNHYLPILQR